MTNDHDRSLWELLGIDPATTVPPVADDAWERALHIAMDPDTPPIGDDLVPSDDPVDGGFDEVDPVAVDVDLDDVRDDPGHGTGSDDTEFGDTGFVDTGFDNTGFDDTGFGDTALDDGGYDDAGHHNIGGDADLG